MLENQSITKKIKILVLIVAVIIILAFCVEVFGVFKGNKEITINIPSGSGLAKIAEILEEKDVIGSKSLFMVLSIDKKTEFKAGHHTFTSRNYFKVKEELVKAPLAEAVTVTIPEGYEQREIARLLEEKGLCTAEEFNTQATVENFKDYWFISNIKQRDCQLEGYLFPDTYEFSYSEGAKSIINKMLNNFENKITEKMRHQAQKLNMTFDEIITMASIIEREAADNKEYKTVSGVFYNRLNENTEAAGYLQSCATVQYILKERKNVLSVKDTEIDSPYNTYKYKGLPVGPVASPGLATIEAALYPADTDYIYFVADGNGNHYFAETYEEHQKNMRKAGL